MTSTATFNEPPPLEGLRVVEGSAFVAAPLGGMTLAQLGADVIRFDAVGGGIDYHRWPCTPGGHEPVLGQHEQGQAVDRRRRAQARGPGAGRRAHHRARARRRGVPLQLPRGRAGSPTRGSGPAATTSSTSTSSAIPTGRTAVDYTVNPSSGFAYATGPAGGSHADQPRAAGVGHVDRPARRRRPCWPPSGAAPATAPATSSPSRSPTWPSPWCPTSATWPRPSCSARTGPRSATTCTAPSAATSPPPTAAA